MIKKSVSGVLILILVAVGFFVFQNFSNKITGNDIVDIDSCSKVVSGVSYNATSDSLTSRSNSVLCHQRVLYRCGDLGATLNPQFTSASLAQRIGSWKCAASQKIWVPASSCVVNYSNSAYHTYAYNNTFGYNSSYPAVYTPEYKIYCLNGQFYQCGNKYLASLYINLSSGGVAGNYQCFNSSGANRWFYLNNSCLSYSNSNYYLSNVNSVGLSAITSSNPTDYTTGLQTDNKFLCYNNQRYYCGTSPTQSANSVSDGNIIGNTWKCTSGQWNTFKPTITSASSICNCGSSCSFNFGSLVGQDSFTFNVSIVYNLINGSSRRVNALVNPTISGQNALGSYSPTLDCSGQGAVVTSARFEVANSNSIAGSSAFRVHSFDVNYSSCTNECNISGVTECTANNGYRTCGQYDSDACLEYSITTQCVSGTVCTSGQCLVGGRTDTCTPSGKQCYSSLPLFAINYSSSFDCPLNGQVCFQCNQNYTWNGSACLINSCPAGQHISDNVCVSNNCGGSLPTGGNYSNGSAAFTAGNSRNWSFIQLSSNLSGCQWTCNAGYRLNSVDNNSCIVGKYNCSSLIGAVCSNQSLTSSTVNLSNYASCPNAGDSCIRILICNDSDNGVNYSVKGNVSFNYLGQSDDVILFEDRCEVARADGSGADAAVNGACSGSLCTVVDYTCNSEKNLVLNHQTCPGSCSNGACVSGGIGIVPTTCSPGKCSYNSSCFNNGFRLTNSSGKYYCSSSSFSAQKTINQTCSSNFECITNFCDSVQGKCVDIVGTVTSAAGWLRKVSCWISNGFNTNSADYLQCLSRSS